MKTAFVTGASGKIGSATVVEFIKNGYFVIGQYNKGEENIYALKENLKSLGLLDYFFSVKSDFNDMEQIKSAVDCVQKSFKSIDVLVLNAGVDLYKLAHQTTEEEFDLLLNVNVKSNFMLTKAFLPSMIEKKKGKIIFVSSIWGQNGASMESVYSLTKSAQIGYAKSLAKEVGLSGITVNCVCPGIVDTDMNQRLLKEELTDIVNQIPMQRMCIPKEVASLIYFLASENGDYITGQAITIDGGWTL